MRRRKISGCMVVAMIVSLAGWLDVAVSEESIVVTLQESRSPITDDPQRKGLEVVERRLQMGNNLYIRYLLVIDPKQNNQPIIQRYGDYFLSCGFPSWAWNWDLEYFLDVSVAQKDEKPFVVNRASLQEGMSVLEQGKRGIADLVWKLPSTDGQMGVRIVKVAGEAEWFYMDIALENAPHARITQVRLGCYPFITAGPPERKRWVSTLTGAYPLSDSPRPLTSATEWGLVLHNKNAHEEGGCLVVFDPNEIQSVSVGGTYGVSVYLTPQTGSQAVHLALGYFWGVHYEQAVAHFRQQAPNILKKLRAMNWTVQLDLKAWAKERRKVESLLRHPTAQAQFGDQWVPLVHEVEGLLADLQRQTASGKPPSRAKERQFFTLLKRTQQFKTSLYDAALHALIQEATE